MSVVVWLIMYVGLLCVLCLWLCYLLFYVCLRCVFVAFAYVGIHTSGLLGRYYTVLLVYFWIIVFRDDAFFVLWCVMLFVLCFPICLLCIFKFVDVSDCCWWQCCVCCCYFALCCVMLARCVLFVCLWFVFVWCCIVQMIMYILCCFVHVCCYVCMCLCDMICLYCCLLFVA